MKENTIPYDYNTKDFVTSVNLGLLGLSSYQSILDYGCGNGQFGFELIKRGYDVTGADVSREALKEFQDKLTKKGIENVNLMLIDPNLYKLPFKDDIFDIAICREVLEHVFDYDNIIKELARVTKKGGVVMISVPNSLSEKLFSLFDPKWLRKSDHCNLFTARNIKYLCERNNLCLFKREAKLFFWSFNWFFLSMVKTDHFMGRIKNNLTIYETLIRFWSILSALKFKKKIEVIGNKIFPKSYFYYLRNKK